MGQILSFLPPINLNSMAASCRQAVSTASSNFVDPIAPTIVSEAFYHLVKNMNAYMVTRQYSRVCDLNPSLRYPVILPFMMVLGLSQLDQFKQTRFGGFIDRNRQKIVNTAHLALAGLEIAYGKRVEGATHIITWAYFNAPEGKISPKVDLFARRVIIAACVISTASFFYNRPFLMLALLITPVAITAIMIKVSVDDSRKRLRWIAENVIPNHPQYQAVCLDFAFHFWTASGKLITGQYVMPQIGPTDKG